MPQAEDESGKAAYFEACRTSPMPRYADSDRGTFLPQTPQQQKKGRQSGVPNVFSRRRYWGHAMSCPFANRDEKWMNNQPERVACENNRQH